MPDPDISETTEAAVGAAGEPPKADDVLLHAVDLARTALLGITSAESIGDPVGHLAIEEHVLSLYFECLLTGYPGWHWTVSLSRIDENSEPFVLETELTPGEHALLAPDWVPWADRLADYRAAQDLAAAEAASLDAGADEEDLDEDDLDDDVDGALDDLDDEVDEDDLDDDLDVDHGDDHGDDVLDGIDFAEHEPGDRAGQPDGGADEADESDDTGARV